MSNTDAYKLIGERTAEMAKNSDIQIKMMELIKQGKSKEQVINWLYMNAIGTLCVFCIKDNILDNIDFEELILSIQCNESEVTEETVKKVFGEILKIKMEDAKFLLNKHMQKIIEYCN